MDQSQMIEIKRQEKPSVFPCRNCGRLANRLLVSACATNILALWRRRKKSNAQHRQPSSLYEII
jgi:hypothetical protein